jgi:K+-transporting ATPase A subunit
VLGLTHYFRVARQSGKTVTGVSRLTAVVVSNRVGRSGLTINGGAHGFAEFLFKHTSWFAHNGQSWATLNLQ